MVLRVITTGRNKGISCVHDRSKQWYYVWSRQIEKIVLRVITTGRDSEHRSSPYSCWWNNKKVLLFTGTRILFGKGAHCNSTSGLPSISVYCCHLLLILVSASQKMKTDKKVFSYNHN